MNKVKTILLGTLTSIFILFLGVTPILADANNPYGPHIPVPTGLGDIEAIAVAGGVLYLGGMTLISYSSFLKKKLTK
jgi:hypothetical protein